MSLEKLVEVIREKTSEWGEVLEPGASQDDIECANQSLKSANSIIIPNEYCEFLKIHNGLEFNGLIFYGTKNSVVDSEASTLDIVEMNKIHKDSVRVSVLNLLVIGESSIGILTYEEDNKVFQVRDRISTERIDTFSTFLELFEQEVSKVI